MSNKTFKILSIDAICGCERNSWEWNNWYTVEEIEEIPTSDLKIIQLFIDLGLLEKSAKRKVYVNDDQYNYVITAKKGHRPLYAIEYGANL